MKEKDLYYFIIGHRPDIPLPEFLNDPALVILYAAGQLEDQAVQQGTAVERVGVVPLAKIRSCAFIRKIAQVCGYHTLPDSRRAVKDQSPGRCRLPEPFREQGDEPSPAHDLILQDQTHLQSVRHRQQMRFDLRDISCDLPAGCSSSSS